MARTTSQIMLSGRMCLPHAEHRCNPGGSKPNGYRRVREPPLARAHGSPPIQVGTARDRDHLSVDADPHPK
jgi:hypothetical protein